jgi:meso-butanediol dehydrogenase / (S,S)-butanediol dehydrogenase / diacetyl reductase
MNGLNRLVGKVAVITGSTKGIGSSIARVFAAEGAKVVVSGRDAAAGGEVVADITSAGGVAVFQKADVSVEADVKGLMQCAEQKWGRIDVLVNNAAPSDFIARGGEMSVVDLPTENWDYMLRATITGPFWGCKYAIPVMRRSGGGSIVNISSMSSKFGLVRLAGYTSAKGAMNALTRQVAVEFGKDGIRANAIVIGFIPSGSNASQQVVDDPVTGPVVRGLSLTRMGRPEDVAYVSLFLSTEEAEFITGAEIPVDGGCMIRPPGIRSPWSGEPL